MGYPKNPETIITPADNYNYTKNITEGHIWSYYENMKKNILTLLKNIKLKNIQIDTTKPSCNKTI